MLLKRFIDVEKSEQPAVLWSFAYFFCLLSCYYILRPVRDEMGITAGVANLQWLFSGTFAVMLAAVPVFGWAASRFPRRRLLPLVYGFFTLNLLIFFGWLTSGATPAVVAAAFFIWVSVFNLFVVSVFWSFVADLFSTAQARRLFGFIAAGGSLGAIAGPLLTAVFAPLVGTANLLLLSALFLGLAIVCIDRLSARAIATSTGTSTGAALRGSVWSGLRLIAGSRLLMGICGYILLYTTLSTFLYFEQARIVQDAIADSAGRTRLFALIDLAVNTLTLIGQIFVTGRVVTRFGLPLALSLIPAATVAGFACLALAPLLAVLVAFQIIRRAGDFIFARPAREMLFTLVNREARYKSKNVIDTVVYRGGDAASGWLVAGLKAMGASTVATAWIALPIAALWLATGWALGRSAETPISSGDAARLMNNPTGDET